MPIKSLTSPEDIKQMIAQETDKRLKLLIRQLSIIGEKVVDHAKSLPSPSLADFENKNSIPPHQPNYIDWSKHLKESIGYIVGINGEPVVADAFESVKGGTIGRNAGQEYARELLRKHPKGVVLIVVAGMHYASYVTKYGYDVLDTAELLASDLLKQLESSSR